MSNVQFFGVLIVLSVDANSLEERHQVIGYPLICIFIWFLVAFAHFETAKQRSYVNGGGALS